MNTNEAVDTIEAGRYRIDIYRDDNAENPWENWDGCVPMIVDGGRSFRSHDYEGAGAAFYPSATMYRRHKKALLEVFGIDPNEEYCGQKATPDETFDAFEEAVADALRENDFDKLEAVADIIGLPCLNTSSNGYCQGDHVKILAVWPKEWADRNRPKATPDEIQAELKGAVDLFGAWAWNDVFGYVVTDTVTDDEVGSCWSFYGTDHKKSGLLEQAMDEAKRAERTEKERHTKRLKGWIRNRVPFTVREPFMQAHA